MTAPAHPRRREASWRLLQAGIFVLAVGLGWAIGDHLAAGLVPAVTGLAVVVLTRVHRSKTGRWP